MIKRHYVVALATAALAAAPALYAQTAATTSANVTAALRPHHGRHGMMAKELGLTASQKAQMKAIHKKYAAQFRGERAQFRAAHKADFAAIKADRARGDTAAARAVREKLRDDMAPARQAHKQEMIEMRGVLTPAQQQKWDTHVAARRAHEQAHRDRRMHRGNGR